MTLAAMESTDELKARGAFYTPAELTGFLAQWAVRSADDRVLEPSCGDGAFISALAARFASLGRTTLGDHLIAVEREPQEALKARSLAPTADIRRLDFFDLHSGTITPVAAAIGNPPYIRYHGFIGEDRAKALERAQEQGVELTRLASSWAHFVVHATGFLQPGGRLAMVLPAELLHADYGQPVRELLLRRFSSVVVIAFDRMVFAHAQVDAVLLLASQDDGLGLRVIRVADEHALASLDLGTKLHRSNFRGLSRWSASVDVDAGDTYHDALMSFGSARLGEHAEVDIGFVTGANDFFVLSNEDVERLKLPASVLTPALRRPSDVRGMEVRTGDLHWLMNLAPEIPLDASTRAYLTYGEATGISQHYKCRVRSPWYRVPLPKRHPNAFLPYMSHLGPRLIVNAAGAWSTNLLHGVALRPDAPPARALAVAMASSLTLLSAEVEGRAYGGGVLKLETREAERLAVPLITEPLADQLAASFAEAERLTLSGDIRSVARLADAILGLDHDRLWNAYMVFRDRRLGRRRPTRQKRRQP